MTVLTDTRTTTLVFFQEVDDKPYADASNSWHIREEAATTSLPVDGDTLSLCGELITGQDKRPVKSRELRAMQVSLSKNPGLTFKACADCLPVAFAHHL